jgi:hypothetical protein
MCIGSRERDIADSEAPKEADTSGGDGGNTEGGASLVLKTQSPAPSHDGAILQILMFTAKPP